MKIYQTFFLLLLAFPLRSQDLSGTWEGTGGSGAPYLRLVIIKTTDGYVGYTYDVDRSGYCKADFEGRFDAPSNKLKGKGTGFIERTFNHILCNYNLTYSKSGGVHYLDGITTPKSVTAKIFTLGMPTGNVHLTRVSTSIDTTELMLKEIVKTQPLADVKPAEIIAAPPAPALTPEDSVLALRNTRSDDTLSVIAVTNNNILLKIFDNGITDGDSISILYNNKLLVARIGVSGKIMEIPVELDVNNISHTITLVAHNLGTIPPNTATIIIETGEKKYTLAASTDFRKNATIIIKRGSQ